MARFRKKSPEIEAEQLVSYHDAPRIVEWVQANGGKATYRQPPKCGVEVLLMTLRGEVRVEYGDWIIRDCYGGFHTERNSIFMSNYELVT